MALLESVQSSHAYLSSLLFNLIEKVNGAEGTGDPMQEDSFSFSLKLFKVSDFKNGLKWRENFLTGNRIKATPATKYVQLIICVVF